MRVLVAEEMGMCFGVRDALKMLEVIDRPENVTIHGQLVHNEVVISQLGARGFRMVGEADRQQLPESETVLITAHGISERERTRLEGAGKRLIDTTCPLVKRVHETAMRLADEGNHVLLIGRPGHVEVRGIVEDLEHFDIIQSLAQVRAYSSRNLAVICQTTVSPRTVSAVHSAIVAANPHAEIRFIDTTCQPTRLRQRSVEKLVPMVQSMVVVGGKNSNNTRELAELCRERKVPAHHVQSATDLKREWFHGIEAVGVTAGTSTLDETIREVREWLVGFSNESEERRHSAKWVKHFRENKDRLLPIPWQKGAILSDEERAAMIPTLQDMQLCESSEGKHGLKLADKYGQRINDPEYVVALQAFFAEENRHSSYLGSYLALAGEPTVRRSWTDFFFRRIRRLMGLETFLTVILTAELAGMVCYRAFRDATNCELLKRICTQLMRDEKSHLRFHIERLRLVRKNNSRVGRFVRNSIQRCLFAGVFVAVWWKHGRAIRRGGFGIRRFWRETWRENRIAMRQTRF